MVYRARFTVRFGDVDEARIVYYPRFINFFHVAFEQCWEEELGFPYHVVLDERDLAFPAVNVNVDFERPLRFGDRVEIAVYVEKVGRSSVNWLHLVYRNGEPDPVAQARIATVAVEMGTLKKIPIPDWVRPSLEDYHRRCPPPGMD